ncbi:MAG: diacylglycerol/lipid kinase family protein [Solitalea-like symbiont of Acarus siro]
MITDTRKKLFFVVNPIAGGKSKSKAISIINSEIDNLKFEIQIEVSKGKEHLQALAQGAINNNFYAIIVVGGDGTVNALATEIINAKADILLGIIPVGSGNGLARHLKISSCYYKACKIINNLNFTKIDAISLNGLIALNVVGLGFEALVAKKFAAIKTKRGLINFVRITK